MIQFNVVLGLVYKTHHGTTYTVKVMLIKRNCVSILQIMQLSIVMHSRQQNPQFKDFKPTVFNFEKKDKSHRFKLWPSWINKENTFHIKGLDENHTWISESRHATLVNPK